MEEKQFTFYEVYWEAIKDEDNKTVDAIVTGICEYMFFGREPSAELGKIAVWDDLFEVLRMERARQEKNPSGRTRRRGMPYFTFKYGYYNKMQCLNYEESGAYVRAICEYMFNGKELQGLPPKAKRYFTVTKLPLELSRKRKIAGAKGGKANGKKKTKPTTKTKAATEQETDNVSIATTEQETATENEKEYISDSTQEIDDNEQTSVSETEQQTTVETEQITVSTQGQEDNSETAQEVAAIDSDKEYTLESIEEFGCYGSINSNNSMLEGVNYRELYYFVKETEEAQKVSKYKTVKLYRERYLK